MTQNYLMSSLWYVAAGCFFTAAFGAFAGWLSPTIPARVLWFLAAFSLSAAVVFTVLAAKKPAVGPPSGVSGMSGGCAPFEAIAQNRYPPYGAAIRTQPNALSTQITSYVGNKPISVNGWVYGTAEYPTNPPPWNSNIWFHLTDGTGWVSFAAVRAYPMTQDPDGLNPDGGPPVATSKTCEGAVQ
jgi:hypothetical protein